MCEWCCNWSYGLVAACHRVIQFNGEELAFIAASIDRVGALKHVEPPEQLAYTLSRREQVCFIKLFLKQKLE